MKKFNGKYGKWIRLVAFLIVFFLIDDFLSTNLVQSGLSRIIIHEMNDSTAEYDCVVYGESHSTYAIDTEVIEKETGMKTMNASIGGEYMQDMYYMLLDMYQYNNPKVIVLDIDYQYFINIPYKENTVMSTLVYNNYPLSRRKIAYGYNVLMEKEFRAALFPWLNNRNDIDIIDGIFWNKRTEAYKNYDPATVTQINPNDTYKGKGFLYRDKTYIRDESTKLGIFWNESKVDYTRAPEYFKKIVDLCRSKGSQVIMITSPINLETLRFNEDTLVNYNKIEQYFDKLARDNDLTYYNFNLVRPEKYIRDTTDYWDFDGHMYGEAAEKYSAFLGDFIDKIVKGEKVDYSQYIYDSIYDMNDNYDADVVSAQK